MALQKGLGVQTMAEKKKSNLLGEWLQRELDKAGLNVTEYASKSKVAHTILFRILSGSATPTLNTLDKLARYSKTDIGLLARMCFPDAASNVPLEIQGIAEQINQLPTVYREAMIAMIRGLLANQERSKNG